ncbi:MAG: protein kinase family protein [Clostridiales bacterium]|nr:protein kinase family protein [Clostridiales bacterium]
MTQIGSVIDNKYEILKLIGQGGMSTVYLAMDKRLNKQWAVKEIRKEASGKNNDVIVQSLLAEANLMKRFDHSSLPRIVDIIDNGKTIYVVMDYIEGEPLDRILNEYGAQPQDLVIDWAKQLCDVLGYLHTRTPAVIYRDMKPANIMLKPEGNLKLIDFGIAREYKEQNLADTVSLGTKGYAAPEQFGGKGQTDARTDIYCLGVTLYHLVTGQNPCEPPYELYPIRQWNPSLSGGFERIIQKCTQLNPADRYQSCSELLYALEHYEEVDDTYRNKQKKKLKLFILVASFTTLFLFIGIFGNVMATSENNKDYESKISIQTSTGFEDKVSTYIEAIKLMKNDNRAYLKLLEAYTDNNQFGPEERKQFMALYNSYSSEFNVNSLEFAKLNYAIGEIFWGLYEEPSDDSFSLRAIKARDYFGNIVSNAPVDYENRQMAESYFIVCSFYKEYVNNSSSVKEPTSDEYTSLLQSLEVCIENIDNYNSSDKPYIKLTMYLGISELLYSHRQGFAVNGIDQKKVTDLLSSVYQKTNNISVTQDKSLVKKTKILESYDTYLDAIEVTYKNQGRR